MRDQHEQVTELLGVYSLGALPNDERLLVEAHLVVCPACAAEVTDHLRVVDAVSRARDADLGRAWEGVADSLRELTPRMQPVWGESSGSRAGVTPIGGVARRHTRLTRSLVATAAATALVFGVAAGALIGSERQSGEGKQLASISLDNVARRVLGDPEARKVTLSSPDRGMTARAAIESGGSGYLLSITLPDLDERRTYQLWGIRDDAVISLGVLGPSPNVVAFHLDAGVRALAITEEVRGGVPTSANEPVAIGQIA